MLIGSPGASSLTAQRALSGYLSENATEMSVKLTKEITTYVMINEKLWSEYLLSVEMKLEIFSLSLQIMKESLVRFCYFFIKGKPNYFFYYYLQALPLPFRQLFLIPLLNATHYFLSCHWFDDFQPPEFPESTEFVSVCRDIFNAFSSSFVILKDAMRVRYLLV
jgi:hypothetical protein